ncbi:MAG TPA: 50S ribosomal protein L35 [Thermotogota bacterium]|nr:50S ribosomal protein L35 [Thermotogota bacterium]HPJ89324.1 50S ribosomal protein L35 [Thermotogota bacterium]HPR97139.1 50S ribosomal protein L35 [Thermotogota bacterium]
MPKMKTKKSASRRFKITRTGKIMRCKAGRRHETGKKRNKINVRLRQKGQVSETRVNPIKKMMAKA